MAINSNVLLQAIVPDAIGAAKAGFDLGTTIRNAPLLRQQNEQIIQQNEQKIATGNVEAGESESLATYSLMQESPITADNYLQTVTQLKRAGMPLQDDDFELTEENITGLEGLRQMGKAKAQTASGSLAGVQTNAPIITEQVKVDEFGKPVLDAQGNPVVEKYFTSLQTQRGSGAQAVSNVPIQGNVLLNTGESAALKREADNKAKIDAEKKIVDIKNQGLAFGEQEKKLGEERAKISETIRTGATQSRRSKSNLLRLRTALNEANTGRLASARNMVGDFLPNVKDADAETFNALATQYALDELSKQSGTKTDFDFQKAAETQARLGNTKEANKAILSIAFDRLDELEYEERKFKEFVKKGNKEEEFVFEPIPLEYINLVRANPQNEKIKADFKAKFGYLPSGL